MGIKNENFCQAVDYLVSIGKTAGQKDLAYQTGITQTTMSRIMTGKVEPSDDTLRKFNATFDGIFNMKWLRGVDHHMLATNVLGGSPTKEEEGTATALELAAMLIKEVEGLRRELQKEKEQTMRLNAQLAQQLQRIESLLPRQDYLVAAEDSN